jgi:hypothetical protein
MSYEFMKSQDHVWVCKLGVCESAVVHWQS